MNLGVLDAIKCKNWLHFSISARHPCSAEGEGGVQGKSFEQLASTQDILGSEGPGDNDDYGGVTQIL